MKVHEPHEPCASRGECYHARGGHKTSETWGKTREAHEARARGGRKNVESGHLQRIATLESRVKGGSIGGRISGRQNAKSGQLQRIAASGGRVSGRKNVKSGHIQALGRIVGRKNVESGHLARISRGVRSTADGILFRSQMEASFYCVMQELGGQPIYEPNAIKLNDGTSYTLDFVLGNSVLDIPANAPIELKPARNAYYNCNVGKAVKAGATVVYWDDLEEHE